MYNYDQVPSSDGFNFSTPGSNQDDNCYAIKQFFDYTPNPHWDNKSFDYDLGRYPFADEFLQLAQEMKPALMDLEQIHEHFTPSEELQLKRKWERYANSDRFSKKLDQFIEEYLVPRFPRNNYMIQRTPGIRITRPGQEKVGRLVTYHNGFWNGYTNFLHFAWVPLTRSWDSNTLWQSPWDQSREVMLKLHDEEWSLKRVEEECKKMSFPINVNYGSAWLFNAGHLHGSHNNETDITRCSFDFRCTMNGNPARVGFFRFKDDSLENEMTRVRRDGRWVVYVDVNTEMLRHTPHFMIREFCVQFAKSNSINITDWKNEYWYCGWMPHFRELMENGNVDGIIMPSMFGWTVGPERTLELMQSAVDHGVQLLFVDENLVVSDASDIERVRRRFDFVKPNESK